MEPIASLQGGREGVEEEFMRRLRFFVGPLFSGDWRTLLSYVDLSKYAETGIFLSFLDFWGKVLFLNRLWPGQHFQAGKCTHSLF